MPQQTEVIPTGTPNPGAKGEPNKKGTTAPSAASNCRRVTIQIVVDCCKKGQGDGPVTVGAGEGQGDGPKTVGSGDGQGDGPRTGGAGEGQGDGKSTASKVSFLQTEGPGTVGGGGEIGSGDVTITIHIA